MTRRASCCGGAIVALCLLVTVQVAAGANAVDRELLLEMARKHGTVPVIVEMAVPRMEELSQASIANALHADEAMATAIRETADRIVAQLPPGMVETKRVFQSIPFAALHVTELGLMALEIMPEILHIEEDRVLPVPETFKQNDDPYPPLLSNTVKVIGADKAWASGYTGKGWYVAILDTGLLTSHNFFKGKTIQEACFTTKYSAYGAIGICPNGKEEMKGKGSAKHQKTEDAGWDHGTHVSGIAAGKELNVAQAGKSVKLAGVAKQANIIAVNVFSKFQNSSFCSKSSCVLSFTTDQVAGLDYLYSLRNTYKIAAVNMSLGGGKYSSSSKCNSDSASTKAAIDRLRSVGILTLIATGNDGFCDGISTPGCISTAMGVGATDDNDKEAYFSNWHKALADIFAPGVEVYSSTGKSNTSWESWNGTSMATPHVTGAVALIKQSKPAATATEIFSAIQSSGDSTVTTRCKKGTKKRLQVDKAIDVVAKKK